MSAHVLILMIVFASLPVGTPKTVLDDIIWPIANFFQGNIGPLFIMKSNSKLSKALLEVRGKAAKTVPSSIPFPCDIRNIKLRSDQVPTSIHALRPGDIDVIGAMGDSLSAGTGVSATTVTEEVFVSQRGRAFSGGGEKTWRSHLTLPNILKVFNPKLFGYALKACTSTEWSSQFNVAENSAISSEMPYMVKELVKRIKGDSRVDLKNHWKMVTIMIGNNDFCSEVCKLSNYDDALEKHREDLLEVLRYLKNNLPRTIVNIIPPPRLDIFFEMKNLPLECYIVQNVACPCVRGIRYTKNRKQLSEFMKKWQKVDVEISVLPEFQSEDFAVVAQIFTLNYTFPRKPNGEIDYGYLAPDCFHFSEKGHSRFANDLWNTLLEPVGKKSTDGADIFSKFNCPSEEYPYIFTKENSR